MADVVDPKTRSRMMAGIRSRNTKPELFLRKRLHSIGFRYSLHPKGLPGKPDMVFPRHRAVVEIYGCFWHGHGCRYYKLPTTNSEFWKSKINGNQVRDRNNLTKLLNAGWRCLVVWECAIRKSQRNAGELDVVELTAKWLRAGGKFAIIDELGLFTLMH